METGRNVMIIVWNHLELTMKNCIFARNVGSGLHIIMELYGRQIAVMDRSSVTIAVIN